MRLNNQVQFHFHGKKNYNEKNERNIESDGKDRKSLEQSWVKKLIRYHRSNGKVLPTIGFEPMTPAVWKRYSNHWVK